MITKMDLTGAVEFDHQAAVQNILAVQPGMMIFAVSSKTGEGFDEYPSFLESRVSELGAPEAIQA